jgi:hypothetical protein
VRGNGNENGKYLYCNANVLVKLFFSQQALAENPASNIDKAGNEIRKMSLIQVKIMSLDSPGSNKTSVQGCTNDRDFALN